MSLSDRRVPALDGVRGIAIITVFLFHATQLAGIPALESAMRWGWMGVDLFFVLSGYLITGILFDSRHEPKYYSAFYTKRVLRIIPAYTLYLAVLMVVEWPNFHGTQGWYALHLSNVLFWLRGFSVAPHGAEHLWSLAIEEQFYLLWPLAILRCHRPRSAMRLAIGVIVMTAVLRTWALLSGAANADALYVLTPFRADSLAWGAFLAALVRRRRSSFSLTEIAALIGLVGAIGLASVVLRLRDAMWPSPSMQLLGYPLVGMLAASIVAFAVQRPSSLLAAPALRIAGKYSYAGYLWHPLMLFAVRQWTPLRGAAFIAAGLIATTVPVLLSWYLVERPALALKQLLGGASPPPDVVVSA